MTWAALARKPLVVSVDWDFFFPYWPEWDWGHAENPLFEKWAWLARALDRPGLVEEYRPVPQYRAFWDALAGKGLRPRKVFVAESHVRLYGLVLSSGLRGVRVLHFDAHHDAWPLRGDGRVTCENWLAALLRAGAVEEALWVRPSWGFWREEEPPPLPEGVETMTWEEFLGADIGPARETPFAFVCRSPAWTPPWADSKFREFLALAPARPEFLEPVADRHFDIRAVREAHEKMAAFLRQLVKREITA